jgi:carbon monoxide dehydrogenase subunit G
MGEALVSVGGHAARPAPRAIEGHSGMDMNGEYRIPAPRQRVWEALNDPDTLGRCIPGCESIQKTSETSMSAVVQAKVGPVSAKFTGEVTLEDLDPPNGYTIRGEGKGGVAGFAKGTAKVALADDGDGTLLTYAVDAQVGGKLAQVGARLVAGTIKKMADEFFGTFSEIVAAAPSPAASTPVASTDAPEPVAAVGASSPPAPPPKKSWASAYTIGILVIAALLVLYFVAK